MLSGHRFLKHILLLIYASFLHLKKRSEIRSVLIVLLMSAQGPWLSGSSRHQHFRSTETRKALMDADLMETKCCLNTNKPWHHNPQLSTRYPRPVFRRSLMAVLVLYKTLIRHFNWFGRCCWLAGLCGSSGRVPSNRSGPTVNVDEWRWGQGTVYGSVRSCCPAPYPGQNGRVSVWGNN